MNRLRLLTQHHMHLSRCHLDAMTSDVSTRMFDIPQILHINIKNRSRPWTLVKPPIDSRNALIIYRSDIAAFRSTGILMPFFFRYC